MTWRMTAAVAAGLAVLAGAPAAQAQAYSHYSRPLPAYGYVSPYGYGPAVPAYGYGPADPCAREAGNRALGWGLVGLLLGGLAGGAAAGAGVVAEGAALGGFVGGVTGARAGARSAACGTARYSGLPVYGTTASGVAIYGPPRPMYDYGAVEGANNAAYYPPQEPHGGAYDNYEQDYYDRECCDGGRHSSYSRYESDSRYEERYPEPYVDEGYRTPRN